MMRSRSSAVRPSGARSTSYSASASVLDNRSRMLASSPTTRPRGPRRGGGRGSPLAGGARALAFEPRVDVALPEPPLPSNADRRDLSRLDQAVDGPQVDLEVIEYLFGRQEAFVHRCE